MGSRPRAPTAAAYRVLSDKIADKVELMLSETPNGAAQESNTYAKQKADHRDAWVSGSQAFAKRTERGAWRGNSGRERVMAPRHPIRGKFRPRSAPHGQWR
jgi:hypothetical protein